MPRIGLGQLGGSGGSPWQGQIQKLIMTPRVRREVDEETFRGQTVLPKDYDHIDIKDSK